MAFKLANCYPGLLCTTVQVAGLLRSSIGSVSEVIYISGTYLSRRDKLPPLLLRLAFYRSAKGRYSKEVEKFASYHAYAHLEGTYDFNLE